MFVIVKVEKGQTLIDIARQHSTTVQKLRSLNGINETKAGERLVVEKIDGIPYRVKPFESLDAIAAKFGINRYEIEKLNNITEVFFGELIYLPKGGV